MQPQINKPTLIDRVALGILGLIIINPYRSLFHVDVGNAMVSVEEFSIIALISVAVTGTLMKRSAPRLPVAAALMLLVAVSIAGIQLSRMIYGSTGAEVNHGRFFLPLLAAIVVCCCSWRLSAEVVARCIVLFTAASAAIAVCVHLFARDSLAILVGEIDAVEIAQHSGRMLWHRADVAVLALALQSAIPWKSGIRWIAMAIILVGVICTQNRSMVAACSAVLATTWCLSDRGYRAALSRTMILVLAVAIALFASASEHELDVVLHRFFVSDSSSEFDRSFVRGRLPYYEQYVDKLGASPILGHGLGTALAQLPDGQAIYGADISLIGIAIPFGLLGVVLLWLLGAVCWSRATSAKFGIRLSQAVHLAILVGVVLALNVDVWIRNCFVVALAFVVACESANGAGAVGGDKPKQAATR